MFGVHGGGYLKVEVGASTTLDDLWFRNLKLLPSHF
jgi:hypothetical protein